MRLSKFTIMLAQMFRMWRSVRSQVCSDVFLINTVRPILFPFLVERLIAWSLYLRGATVYQLVDFNVQPHYDSTTYRQSEKIRYSKWNFSKFSNEYLIKFVILLTDRKRLKTIELKDYLREDDLNATSHFHNHIISSCRRYDSRFSCNSAGPDTKYYNDCEFIEGVWRHSSANILRKLEIDKVISSHGIYVTWGILHDIANHCGLKTYVISKCPYIHKSVWLTRSALQKIQNDYVVKPISDQDHAGIVNYFDLREQKLAPDTQVFYETSSSSLQQINTPASNGGIRFVAFPNVIWDGAIAERDDVFESIVDWLYATIMAFEKSSNELIVRFHPSEITMFSGSESFESIINEMIPRLADFKNVTIISSTSKINVYDLIKNEADCVLVYDNMTALEAVHCGKPVIFCAAARFESAGFGRKPKNQKEYCQLLRQYDRDIIRKLSKQSEQLNMYSFANWYLNELVYSFPVVNFDDDLRLLTWKDLSAIPRIVNSELIEALLND